jgi:acid phosphatase
LVQVQAIVRHGARTPAAAHTCWEGYNAQVEFSCPVTNLERPSAVRDSNVLLASEGRMYRKIYREGRVNLPGNCHIGQLVEEGLEQCHTRSVLSLYPLTHIVLAVVTSVSHS